MKKNLANYITASRVVIAIVLLFEPSISPFFIVLYTLGGFTDMIDGFIARKLRTESILGSKLDTLADLFFGLIIVKVLFQYANLFFIIWFFIIAFLKILAITIHAIKFKQFVILHTYLNKTMGLLLFLSVYIMGSHYISIYFIITCALGIITALEEILLSLTSNQLYLDRKSFFIKENINRKI